MHDPYDQAPAGARFGWGPVAGQRFGAVCACVVVVDVLSFTTAVEISVERGMRIHPYQWHDASGRPAESWASDRGFALAVGRRGVGPDHPWSLSPDRLRTAPVVEDLVLPSPNGATLSTLAAAGGATVVAACLRNAAAVGRWLRVRGYGRTDRPVAVVAAGERWSDDGSLRPCVEDLLGAGAVLAALVPPDRPADPCSVEAAVARAAWLAVADPSTALRDCASGRELTRAGFAADVTVAAEVGAGDVVPVLRDGAFVRDGRSAN
ncbi:MAG TPA: 2-phosphosulfolactate phosphatase [Mycobacteriales bacterium]|nr:2-phosphosulfolactate phosphatase [Mycobacteriales bacterium]